VSSPLPKVADSSTRRRHGAAGHLIGSEAEKELQAHGGRLRELGLTADQVCVWGGGGACCHDDVYGGWTWDKIGAADI